MDGLRKRFEKYKYPLLVLIVGAVLMGVALPVAGVCVLMGLGAALLAPVGLLLLALGLMRA